MFQENIKVHRSNAKDIETLVQISTETFTESFAAQNTPENLRIYLENLNTDRLAQEVSNPDSEFYLAIVNDQVAGYLKINLRTAQTELAGDEALEIERIYVLKKYQRKNIGGLLFGMALNKAKELSCRYIWLGVWENNDTAISFYKKLGFVEFGEHPFILGHDVQTDILMRVEVNN